MTTIKTSTAPAVIPQESGIADVQQAEPESMPEAHSATCHQDTQLAARLMLGPKLLSPFDPYWLIPTNSPSALEAHGKLPGP